MSKSSDAEKENILAQVEWFPVTTFRYYSASQPFLSGLISLQLYSAIANLPAVSVNYLMYRLSPVMKRKNVLRLGRMASRLSLRIW